MAPIMQLLFNECMLIERRQSINAAPYERSEARYGQANGFKPKTVETAGGSGLCNSPCRRCMALRSYPSAESAVRGARRPCCWRWPRCTCKASPPPA